MTASFKTKLVFLLTLLSFGFLTATNAEETDFLQGEFAKKFDLSVGGQVVDLGDLTNALGQPIEASALNNRVVLVNFWATWCVPCRHEMPSLNKAAELWGDEGLTVLTVSVDKNPKMAVAYLKKNGFSALTFGYDERMQTFNQLEGLGLPFSLLIDRQGHKFGHLSGPAEWSSKDAQTLFNHLL